MERPLPYLKKKPNGMCLCMHIQNVSLGQPDTVAEDRSASVGWLCIILYSRSTIDFKAPVGKCWNVYISVVASGNLKIKYVN